MNTTDALVQGNAEMYDEPQEQGRNPLMVLHLLLQGRYWLAILLAVVLGAGGGVMGYKLSKRTYSSTGMIHIKPVIGSPINIAGANNSLPMFDSFVASQLILLRGQRVVDMAVESAMQSAAWQRAARVYTTDNMDDFQKKLEVSREGEIVRVTFTDADPDVASEAVHAIIDAYSKLYLEAENRNNLAERNQTIALRDRYMAQLKSLDFEISKATDNMGVDAVLSRHQSLVMQANSAEMASRHAKDVLDEYQQLRRWQDGPTTAPAAAQTAPATRKAWTPEEVAKLDNEMYNLLREKDGLEKQRRQMGGVGRNNPQMIALNSQLDAVNDDIKKRMDEFQPPAGAVGGPQSTDMGPQYAAQEQFYAKQFNDLTEAVKKSGETVTAIQGLLHDVENNKTYLESAKRHLEQMDIESGASGRIEIVSTGDRPVLHDKRIPVAAAAAFGGGVAGVGLVLLFGLMDRRLRTIDQARMSLKSGMRVLGMLPSLPRNLEDPGAASFAALCVHHIRMLLQVMPRMDAHPVIAVTSPSPGDGKTSLTLALALSFAASGKSTLLIDCDIVGAGLTRRVNAIIRRRIGQILIRENLITPAQLREALNLAQRTGRKLGEVLVDEGYVDQAQVTQALAMQAETSVGLLDVMRGEVLEECVADTGMARLWILPVGSALAEHGATISPEGFRAVLEQARKRFDVVLVDTGPVPGSIESSVAASQADGVVLCVSRGEQGPLVRRASEHLHDIGSRCLGLVFNRATPEDFSSSYGAMSSPSIPARIPEKPGTDRATFGPVASAVAGTQVKKN